VKCASGFEISQQCWKYGDRNVGKGIVVIEMVTTIIGFRD